MNKCRIEEEVGVKKKKKMVRLITLIDGRVSRKKVVIMFSFRVPHVNTAGTLKDNGDGVITKNTSDINSH